MVSTAAPYASATATRHSPNSARRRDPGVEHRRRRGRLPGDKLVERRRAAGEAAADAAEVGPARPRAQLQEAQDDDATADDDSDDDGGAREDMVSRGPRAHLRGAGAHHPWHDRQLAVGRRHDAQGPAQDDDQSVPHGPRRRRYGHPLHRAPATVAHHLQGL